MPALGPEYIIRNLRRDEIPALLALARAEGRHMGQVGEVTAWQNVDPRAFFVAVSSGDEILGSCCGMRLSDDHGYIGMYNVRPEFRGRGLGKQLWNEAIHHLGNRNKGLSALPELYPMYRDNAGFKHAADWTVDLYATTKKRLSVPLQRECIKFRTVPLDDEKTLNGIIEYDSRLHSYDRSNIVQNTLLEFGTVTRVAVIGGTVYGYGCIKKNLQDMWMITPLYADNKIVAKLLLAALVASLTDDEFDAGIVLKSPSNNLSAVLLFEEVGFQLQNYRLVRCFTKKVVEVPTSQIYALQSSVFCTE